MADDESTTAYTDYKGDTITAHWSLSEESSCLELLLMFWLPPIAIAIMEVIRRGIC